MPIQQAADYVIRKEVAALKGGEGGVIVLDATSEPVWSFNTLGMFRARQVEGSAAQIEVGK
jgi:beta-aspartyl-peptidase (threonine type)